MLGVKPGLACACACDWHPFITASVPPTPTHYRALSRRADLETKLRELAGALAEDMAEEGLRGRTLTLKLKLTTFEVQLGREGLVGGLGC